MSNINKISKGHTGSLESRCSILDLLFWERVGYIQVVILLFEYDFFTNINEKLIHDSITFFLFELLVLYIYRIVLYERQQFIVR